MRHAAQILWILVLTLISATGADADYQTSYDNGLQALEEEQWSEAIDWFREAVQEQPQAGGKISVSGKRHPYIPHYQLGLALYRAGKLRAASDAWRESAVQGVLSKKQQAQVNQFIFDIEARLASVEEVPKAEPELKLSGEEIKARQRAAQRQLDRAANQVAKLAAPDLRAILEADSQLTAQRAQGIEKLRQARQIFETAGKAGDPIALQEVHARAVDAAGRLEDVVLSATIALGPEQQEALAVVEPEGTAEQEPIAESGEVLPIGADAPITIDPTPELPIGPDEETLPTIGAAELPPDFLRAAASALFSARYEDVLAMLEQGRPATVRVRKHVHLFRAAAFYALYLLEDRQDAGRLQAAEAEARACRALDPELMPPAEGFSPSFVHFFESAG